MAYGLNVRGHIEPGRRTKARPLAADPSIYTPPPPPPISAAQAVHARARTSHQQQPGPQQQPLLSARSRPSSSASADTRPALLLLLLLLAVEAAGTMTTTKVSVVALLCAAAAAVLVLVLAVPAAEASHHGHLKLGYYKKTCPGVENVVKYHVAKAIKANRGVGAALVRLIFHDCFVRGCDASVLLDPTPSNPATEKTAPINIGLAGFELIDEIKAAVEDRCPGTVSCADIVVYAARDASSLLSNGHVTFEAPAGRLDGVVSLAADAQRDLPDSTFSISELILNFKRKNFTVEELVILSGAHAVGVGHCSSLRARLTAPPTQIVPAYRNLLAGKCAAGPDPIVPNNVRDEDPAAVAAAFPSFVKKLRKFSFLDNSYYHNNLARIVTFNSDWQLLTEKESLGHVKEYAENGTLWDEDFSDALVKLSKLPMPPHSKGEIRKQCRYVNHPY